VAFLGEAAHQLYALAGIQGFGDKYLPRLIDALTGLNQARE
jgi:hypothetical protein